MKTNLSVKMEIVSSSNGDVTKKKTVPIIVTKMIVVRSKHVFVLYTLMSLHLNIT